jgi:hypothetical protein
MVDDGETEQHEIQGKTKQFWLPAWAHLKSSSPQMASDDMVIWIFPTQAIIDDPWQVL